LALGALAPLLRIGDRRASPAKSQHILRTREDAPSPKSAGEVELRADLDVRRPTAAEPDQAVGGGPWWCSASDGAQRKK